jgi:hypothetical protein
MAMIATTHLASRNISALLGSAQQRQGLTQAEIA